MEHPSNIIGIRILNFIQALQTKSTFYWINGRLEQKRGEYNSDEVLPFKSPAAWYVCCRLKDGCNTQGGTNLCWAKCKLSRRWGGTRFLAWQEITNSIVSIVRSICRSSNRTQRKSGCRLLGNLSHYKTEAPFSSSINRKNASCWMARLLVAQDH